MEKEARRLSRIVELKRQVDVGNGLAIPELGYRLLKQAQTSADTTAALTMIAKDKVRWHLALAWIAEHGSPTSGQTHPSKIETNLFRAYQLKSAKAAYKLYMRLLVKQPRQAQVYFADAVSWRHPKALFQLAKQLDGLGQREAAMRNYEEAGRLGFTEAYNHLGLMFETKDLAKAIKYYKCGTKAGNTESMNSLATWLEHTEPAKAEKLYARAAELHCSNAHYNLALMLWKRGEFFLAEEHWLRASELGDADADFELGQMAEHGKGPRKSSSEIFHLYKRSAKRGCVDSANHVGLLYELGRGVVQNYEKAVKYQRAAADNGNSDAQSELGWLLEKGLGVAKDRDCAQHYYEMAWEQQDHFALFRLAKLRKSEKLYRRTFEAIKQPNSAWQSCMLAELYLKGRGCPQDKELARKLLLPYSDQQTPSQPKALLLLSALATSESEQAEYLRQSIQSADNERLLYEAAKARFQLGKLIEWRDPDQAEQLYLEASLYPKTAMRTPLCYADILKDFIQSIQVEG